MTRKEMCSLLEEEVKGLTSYLDAPDYDHACDDASREIGWAFPVSGDFKVFWMKTRAKRHLFFYLLSESAHKFKVKQISLHQRFEHYDKMIDRMDQQFLAVQEMRPDEFADVESINLFGTVISAGFQYEPQTGIDTTYGEDNIVLHSPDENA